MIPNKIVNTRHGSMIINQNDQYIGRSLEIYGSWAQDDLELFVSVIDLLLQQRSRATFYDVGANIGTHTVALAKHFGQNLKVRSFEAQRQIFYMLCGNVAINGLDNVEVYHAVVSDVSHNDIMIELPDYTLPNNFGGLELVKSRKTDTQHMTKADKEKVKTLSIDYFDEPVDFIKLDIEGMEDVALAGATKTIDTYRPVCFVEMWKTDTDKVKQFFKTANYRAYDHKPDNWIFFPAEGNLGLLNKEPVGL